MARLQIHPGGLLMNIFGLLVWVVALGGIGASTYQCSLQYEDYSVCSKTYQWEWWSLWLEFFLLFALFISSFLESYNRGRMVFLAYFTMATVLTMWSAHNFIMNITTTSISGAFKNPKQSAVNAGAAGFIMVSVANFAILIVLGKDFAYTPPSTTAALQSHQFADPKAAGVNV